MFPPMYVDPGPVVFSNSQTGNNLLYKKTDHTEYMVLPIQLYPHSEQMNPNGVMGFEIPRRCLSKVEGLGRMGGQRNMTCDRRNE